jgi:hypothetical protein
VIAAGAAAANVALLGSAGEDRLGRLTPVDAALARPPEAAAPPGVAATIPESRDDDD